MGWSDESVEQLRKMWAEGLTANEIAKKLGVTKNAIVGKVHRLCLTARPSPIKIKGTEEAELFETIKITESVTEEIIPEVVSEEITKVSVSEEISGKEVCQNGNVKLVDLDSHTCRWPIGDPRDDDFCFCGKKVRAGQTYCDEHAAMAYVKALKR